ncbi:MAG TPA: glycosyltransferase family 87 protein [Chloroflexota bacterium]
MGRLETCYTRLVRPERILDRSWHRRFQVLLGGIALSVVILSVFGTDPYARDAQVPYLMALAWRDSADVYAPLVDLARAYFGPEARGFSHASAYPPLWALLAYPFTLLPFPVAAAIWQTGSLGLVLLAGRRLGIPSGWSLALGAWPPVLTALHLGQWEPLLLLLSVLGWRAALQGRDGQAGLWLGLAAALKLYPAIFLLPFLARRRWRLAATWAAPVALAQVAGALAVGVDGLARYYLTILPTVQAQYSTSEVNVSLAGTARRLFVGTDLFSPLIFAPWIVSVVVALGATLALVTPVRQEPEAAPLALVALPVYWPYQAALALPWLLDRWRAGSRATRWGIAMASCAPPLSNLLLGLARSLVGSHDSPFPGAAGLALSLQPLGLLLLLALAARPTPSPSRSPEPAASG